MPPVHHMRQILRLFVTTFLLVMGANTAVCSETDYKTLYGAATESARLWKQKAEGLEKKNAELKRLLLEDQSAPAKNPIPQPPNQPHFDEFEIEIPSFGVSNVSSYGGPNIKVNVWQKLPGAALMQIGSAAKQKVTIPVSGQALIYRDTVSGDEIYLTNRIASAN